VGGTGVAVDTGLDTVDVGDRTRVAVGTGAVLVAGTTVVGAGVAGVTTEARVAAIMARKTNNRIAPPPMATRGQGDVAGRGATAGELS